jgi:hypothetical protein
VLDIRISEIYTKLKITQEANIEMNISAQRSRKTSKLANVPAVWPGQDTSFNELVYDTPAFKESIKKGLRFFSRKEIAKIERKYKTGLTWNDIDIELSKKGLILRKATFRKYIQAKRIPSAIGYRKTGTGREALYPPQIIDHINVLQYFLRVTDAKAALEVVELLSKKPSNAMEKIEEHINCSLRESIFGYMRDMSSDEDDLQETINKVLHLNPKFRDEIMNDLGEIYDQFHEKYDKLVNKLRSHEMSRKEMTGRGEIP